MSFVRSRTVTLVVIVTMAGGCVEPSTPLNAVIGTVVAAPTCPVEPAPGMSPTPGCAPIPLQGAELIVFDTDGMEVARTTSDSGGRYVLELRPGTYRLEPQPVAAYPATPDAVEFAVQTEHATPVDTVTYDTGIR
ncbi:MAG: MSCRAMM family adhesin SdrC [Actinomycetota bacterium]|nr:MSCRAMM family adhesin SdrC [Actinomycetota bacterium]